MLQKELADGSFLSKLGEDGKKCAEAKKILPTECYILIYGKITGIGGEILTPINRPKDGDKKEATTPKKEPEVNATP